MVSKFVLAPHVWIVAVPETAGVHWNTRSGALPVLPQLPANRLVPLVVPVNVPPCAAMPVGLAQLPAMPAGASEPWQTPRPSVLQRPSICLLHAKRRLPPATQAAISSAHARRHCLPSETAFASDTVRSTARSAAATRVNCRTLVLMPHPPRSSRVTAGGTPGTRERPRGVQAALLTHAPCRLRDRNPVARGLTWVSTGGAKRRCATQL